MNQIGYTFQNPALLTTALTHSSYQNETMSAGGCNERLEFLGDAVLGLVTGQYLYEHYPHQPEGWLSKLRAAVVCEKTLARLARDLDLGNQLRLGHGEEKTGGRNRDSVLSDAMEAVIAAIYLDSDLDTVRAWILKRLVKEIHQAAADPTRDYKTTLQELAQRLGHETVEYRVLEVTGPDHNRVYTVQAMWQGKMLAQGTAGSKKQAEQNAAHKVLEEHLLEAR